MVDFMTREQRSKAMSAVRATETQIEKILRSELHRRGYRFRKNVKTLPGHPDIVLPKYRCVIFVHGCFWHHHKNCKRSKLPTTRPAFWTKKIEENVARSRRSRSGLDHDPAGRSCGPPTGPAPCDVPARQAASADPRDGGSGP
jgi:DNA mismatch endonuclease (patch repair protein)